MQQHKSSTKNPWHLFLYSALQSHLPTTELISKAGRDKWGEKEPIKSAMMESIDIFSSEGYERESPTRFRGAYDNRIVWHPVWIQFKH